MRTALEPARKHYSKMTAACTQFRLLTESLNRFKT